MKVCPKCGGEWSGKGKQCRKCWAKSLMGEGNPMYGKRGKLNPIYGITRSNITKNKISIANKNRKHTLKHNLKIKLSMVQAYKNNPSLKEKTKHMGKNNGRWLGGISLQPYSYTFTTQLKENIRKRDKAICQLCKKPQKIELLQCKQRLSIHHIDYNKLNCKKSNLIALCHKCNCRANANRDYWYAYFTYIMEIKNE